MIARHGMLAVTGVAALLVVSPIMIEPTPRLIWNASASTPVGLYRISPGHLLERGDWVVLRTPASVRMLAARRRYIPADVPLVKRVRAAAGQSVCGVGAIVTVDSAVAVLRRSHDPHGRPMPRWEGCQRLARGEIFVLGNAPDSFDGRYFGPVGAADVIGKAVPLWTR